MFHIQGLVIGQGEHGEWVVHRKSLASRERAYNPLGGGSGAGTKQPPVARGYRGLLLVPAYGT